MKAYFCNGISKEKTNFTNENNKFIIYDLGVDAPDRYIYPNDSIKYELDNELVKLYDTFQHLFFQNDDEYYNNIYNMPIWVQDSGQNSDFRISANEFQKAICLKQYQNIPNLNKYLYLIDCQYLIGTIQNLLSSMENLFIRYYIVLSNSKVDSTYSDSSENTIYEVSETSREASSILETYFTKAYSILDMICKLCFELQNNNDDFSSYKKIKACNKLWGDRKHLNINGKIDTLFEPCDLINMIESLRNEAVHNGTWELNPKIFIRFDKNIIIERFMLFPDMTEGRLDCVKNRRHFFSNVVKVNEILPIIHLEFNKKLFCTIKEMNNCHL